MDSHRAANLDAGDHPKTGLGPMSLQNVKVSVEGIGEEKNFSLPKLAEFLLSRGGPYLFWLGRFPRNRVLLTNVNT